MRIYNCKVNHLANPLGYDLGKPVFSWTVEASGKHAVSSRLTVEAAGQTVLDTGWTELDSLCTRPVFPLSPRTGYTWRVSVKTDSGEEASSEENWFETSRMDESWTGKWIGCDDNEPRLPVFTKSFAPAKPLSSARLYICGLGTYEAAINGKRVGDEHMTPYCNNYNAWVQYQTYDVTDLISGQSSISVLLGNGWYKSRFGGDTKKPPFYGDSWKLLCDLILTYEDGTEDIIGSDESWTISRSNTFFSGIYDGEQVDDNLPVIMPMPACLTLPPKGKLTARLSTPVRIRQEITPDIIVTPAGETVLDTRQNMTGIFRLKVNEPKGAKIHLQFGEILQNGNFYRDNLRSAKAEFVYISDGKKHVIEPKFTFYGYRFVKVEGISDLNPEDFTALVMYSEIPRTGWLSTGNALVNQLIHNAEWGQLGNFLDVPTDCPQRDERLGWTGDAQVFAPTACYQRDCAAFYAKYLHDLYEEQKLTGGEVPVVVPSFDLNKGCSTAWGDAACIIPWTVYEYTGDKTILENQFESMRGWVDFIERLENDNHSWRTHFHFGDWLALDCPKAAKGFVGATDRTFIALTYFRYSALLTSKAAEVIGNAEAREHYGKLADSILKEIRKEYFTPAGRCAVPTQTAYLLTLRHGLSTDTARIQKDLADKLTSNEDMLETGFVGTPLLCEELTEAGYADKAFKLLLNEEYPGWLYAVKMGATTIWERWNSVLPDGSISDTGMNSLNHYSYGSIVHWLYRDVAGIGPLAPGFTKAKLEPHFSEALGYVEARFISVSGEWRIQWKLESEGTVNYSCTVPFGCTAKLILPGMETQTLDSGEYRFSCKLPEPVINKNGAVDTPFD